MTIVQKTIEARVVTLEYAREDMYRLTSCLRPFRHRFLIQPAMKPNHGDEDKCSF